MGPVVSDKKDRSPIVRHTKTEICFRVDDVEPCQEPLLVTNARMQFKKRLGRSLEAFTHEEATDIVRSDGSMEHGLVHAVYLAFSQHRPLVLTPDVIWLTLAQGFAQHVNNHAEPLRSCMVAHKESVTLTAMTRRLSTLQDWTSLIHQWSTQLESHIPPELYQLMLCDFSTTTPTTRTASQIVMMDAFQQYFDYHAGFICGIPTVTVRGSAEDWVAIRKRVDVMAGYHLEWWTDRLIPICDGFIETVQGNPSQTFWKHIFSPQEVYGGTCITGWLADLFPYLTDSISKAPVVRNQLLSIPREQLTSEGGLSMDCVPTGLSCAPFRLNFNDGLGQPSKQMELIAGFIGVKQEATIGWLEPEIGWAVVEQDAYSKVITQLAAAAPSEVAMTGSLAEAHEHLDFFGADVPRELIQLMERFPQGSRFYADTTRPWSLRPMSRLAFRQVSVPNLQICEPGVHFMDLSDGRGVAYLYGQHNLSQHGWIILGQPDDQEFQPGSITVIASGILEFLQRLVNAEGRYYFDEPDFKPRE